MASPAEKKKRLLEIADPLPRAAVERHFQRLDGDYWNEFSAEEIRGHIQALLDLPPSRPHCARVEILEEGWTGLTLIGGDFPGFLAAVSGFLAADGYDIGAAKAFTFAPDPELPALPRGGIVDFLLLRRPDPPPDAASLEREMETLFARFEAGEGAAIRSDLYRRLGECLEARPFEGSSESPLEIRAEILANGARLVVRGPDRRAMLFCIAGALSLRGLSLDKLITAAPAEGLFEDRLSVSGPGRQPLRDTVDLEKARVGIALMERLLHAPAGSPGLRPAALQPAAEGLQALVEDWLDESGDLARGGERFLPALSRVLAEGPRMWEAVLRMGPGAFRALVSELAAAVQFPDRPARRADLDGLREGAADAQEFFARLRDYRDRELLKAELDFLLTPARDPDDLARNLQGLAEALLECAADAARSDLEARHGRAGPFALFALGKFGGEELGPGSDLEILLVYGGEGETEGPEPLRPGEFHERMMRALSEALRMPGPETLSLDLRLRPHGESGPLAASREAFAAYYAPGGGALEYERQALIRLRFVHGDPELGREILRRRDEIAFADPPVPIAHTLELLDQLSRSKDKPGLWNAKYSPGGMAELEYGIQFLQLAHGAAHPALRTHSLQAALDGLLETGVLSLAEFEHLLAARHFLRRLINALRLARGRAQDLHCPRRDSADFSFLARRLGYAREGAEERLESDLRRARAAVSAFFRHRFRGSEKPDWLYESLSQALMDPTASLDEAAPALRRLGMRDLPRARRIFRDLFGLLVEKRLAAALLLHFESRFRRSPDPEAVAQRVAAYLEGLPYPDLFIRQALHHPALLETLLVLFANSDVLSDLALRAGEGFKELIRPESLERPRLREELAAEADAAARPGGEAGSAALCRLRNREYLRIALRDLRLGVHLQKITFEISALSDALVAAAFAGAFARAGSDSLRACVLALGKLGGQELNYSSDIDLVFVLDDAAAGDGGREILEAACRDLIGELTRGTEEGRLFRVDMNLRPWGAQGPLAGTAGQYRDYFAREADGWELQAWLKARALCGNLALGRDLIRRVQERACAPENRTRVEDSMRKVRRLGLDRLEDAAGEVKLGPGGIRTVEFYVQAQQIRHGSEHPELITGNTLEALGRLNRYGLLSEHRFHLLSRAYVFLRRVEHRLQLQGLQQRHALPSQSADLDRLARQMGFEDRVGQSAVSLFLEQYRKHMLSLQPISAELFDH